MVVDWGSVLVLTLALSVMFAIGLNLDLSAVRQALTSYRHLLLGIVVNLVLFPLLTFLCVFLFEMEGAFRFGVLLCGLAAGGSTGLLFSTHARADMPYSLALFLLINALSLLLVPLWLIFIWDNPALSGWVLVWEGVEAILIYQLAPLLVGIVVRMCSGFIASRIYPFAKRIADVSLLLLFIGFAMTEGDYLLDVALESYLGLIAIVGVGAGATQIFLQQHAPKQRGLLYVTSVRNLTLALLINERLAQDGTVTLSILTYGLIMYAVCGLCLWLQKRPKKKASP